ncbi:hypothetical protein KDW07_25300 [Burkholderia dolosa]|uniref:N-acyl homoserine lactonase n=1 Tax=Burkholderia dolosa TaxID=152500 RepID=UPI001590103A|nr:N-acyl homoserine lactonase [Burkholderia dolosa]MBR8460470.1 hypothetical protein [Burkholderia dolosa]
MNLFVKFLASLVAMFFLSQTATAKNATTQEGTKIIDYVGPIAISQLRDWYYKNPKDCGGPYRPAFLCSGVMLRATVESPAFQPWNPSPASQTSGGVSFSWIRTDDNFSHLAYGYKNGFIIYPGFSALEDKDAIMVLCAYSMDGGTDNRPGNGCGASTNYPTESRPCITQGITDAQKWIEHFTSLKVKYSDQCGWDVTKGHAGIADHFYQSILARQKMLSPWWETQNELRLATWKQNNGEKLPIHSFFYITGDDQALANAKNDQKRFYQEYGIVIPVISISLPISKDKKASFSYKRSDQSSEVL